MPCTKSTMVLHIVGETMRFGGIATLYPWYMVYESQFLEFGCFVMVISRGVFITMHYSFHFKQLNAQQDVHWVSTQTSRVSLCLYYNQSVVVARWRSVTSASTVQSSKRANLDLLQLTWVGLLQIRRWNLVSCSSKPIIHADKAKYTGDAFWNATRDKEFNVKVCI